MAQRRTRLDLRTRVRREAQKLVDAGAFTDTQANLFVAEALGRVWWRLLKTNENYGLARRDFTEVVGPTITLPDNFSDLRAITRNGETIDEISLIEAVDLDVFNKPERARGTYMIEGPGEDFNAGLDQYLVYSSRLRFFPDLVGNDVVTLAYSVQPPSLGDPADPADDSIEIDVLNEPFERVLVLEAAEQFVGREDNAQRKSIANRLGIAYQEFETIFHRRRRSGINSYQKWRRPSRSATGYYRRR